MSCCNAGCGCTTSTTSDGLLKFSGLAATAEGGGSQVSYLVDTGPDTITGFPTFTSPDYPLAQRRTMQGLSVNLIGVTLSPGQTILVELLKNGTAVPGFSVSFGSGDTGVKSNPDAPRTTFPVGSTFSLRVTTAGFSGSGVPLSATIGVV
jgi:hypothetical protein